MQLHAFRVHLPCQFEQTLTFGDIVADRFRHALSKCDLVQQASQIL